MLRLLDRTYARFRSAWEGFTNPNIADEEFKSGIELGIELGKAQVRLALDNHDPYQFQNNHFKLGYYYAYETVKKVGNGNDNAMA